MMLYVVTALEPRGGFANDDDSRSCLFCRVQSMRNAPACDPCIVSHSKLALLARHRQLCISKAPVGVQCMHAARQTCSSLTQLVVQVYCN